MTKTFGLSFLLIACSLPFLSCLIDTGNKSLRYPCESGEYDFTRYHQYDDKDSLAAVLVVDKEKDTLSRDYFKYDSTGRLLQTIWIYRNLNSSEDTLCHNYEKDASGKEIRGFKCDDETNTLSISHLNSDGRTERVVFYSSDSIILNESILTYNEKGLLIQIDMKEGDSTYTRGKNVYDENGFWIEAVEFDRSGNLIWRTVNSKEPHGRTRAFLYDQDGRLKRWEVIFYNSIGNIEKSISCKSK